MACAWFAIAPSYQKFIGFPWIAINHKLKQRQLGNECLCFIVDTYIHTIALSVAHRFVERKKCVSRWCVVVSSSSIVIVFWEIPQVNQRTMDAMKLNKTIKDLWVSRASVISIENMQFSTIHNSSAKHSKSTNIAFCMAAPVAILTATTSLAMNVSTANVCNSSDWIYRNG